MQVDSSCYPIPMSYDLAPWLIAIATTCSFATAGLLWWHRRAQMLSGRPGPKAWPIIGAMPNLLPNWGRLHDYMLEFFSASVRTIHLAFPLGDAAVYTVDPACVEYVLKTQFAKYPKVFIRPPSFSKSGAPASCTFLQKSSEAQCFGMQLMTSVEYEFGKLCSSGGFAYNALHYTNTISCSDSYYNHYIR